jgi:2',3'-cyclic-nucleotide 2'-phosphodiesterase (5'-nucleotidase family)
MLNGKQMIQAFNTLGLDFVIFGNHEFDLNESELISFPILSFDMIQLTC